ncbi:MAG: serine hydrolase domain-containing protein, partial [Bacteroidota bacterium]
TSAVFDIASLAKQFTGFAIAKLELEEKLDPNDPLNRYFPELSTLGEDMTLGHLVHHSSGLRDIGELFDIGHFGSDLTAERTLSIMSMQRELNFVPGSESDYSNTNYVILAKIVEQISNQSFSSWAEENIFSPMDMSHSFANDNSKVIIPNRAVAYYQREEGYSFDQNNGMSLIGSSAIYSSSTDLGKWAVSLLSNKAYQIVFDRMQKKGRLNDGSLINYGYGIGITEFRGKNMFVHTGSTPAGFRTSIALIPKDKKAIILLSNLGDIDLTRQFQDPILEILFGKERLPEELASAPEKVMEAVELSDNQLDKFVGSYLFNQDRTVQIRKGLNGLTVQPEEAPEMPLVPLAENKLDFQAFKSVLKFSEESHGKFQKAQIFIDDNTAGKLERVELIKEEEFNSASYLGTYFCEELDLLWTIKSNDENLFVQDTKKGLIEFKPLTANIFRDQMNQDLRIEFELTRENRVVGFRLNRGSRMRNLLFHKVALKAD